MGSFLGKNLEEMGKWPGRGKPQPGHRYEAKMLR